MTITAALILTYSRVCSEQFPHRLNLTYTANRNFFYDTLSHPVAQAEKNYYMCLLIRFSSPFPYMKYILVTEKKKKRWQQNIRLVIIVNRTEDDEYF